MSQKVATPDFSKHDMTPKEALQNFKVAITDQASVYIAFERANPLDCARVLRELAEHIEKQIREGKLKVI